MRANIKNGTPVSAESLCRTCRSGVVMDGFSESLVRIHCSMMGKDVKFPVYKCTNYDDKRLPSRWDMEQVAWVFVTKPGSGKKVGFVSNKEFRKEYHEPVLPEGTL